MQFHKKVYIFLRTYYQQVLLIRDLLHVQLKHPFPQHREDHLLKDLRHQTLKSRQEVRGEIWDKRYRGGKKEIPNLELGKKSEMNYISNEKWKV